MARDKFAKLPRIPTNEELKEEIENFFDGLALVTWEADRFFVVFPGVRPRNNPLPRGDRWVEVTLIGDNLDVLTREQDKAINALADALFRDLVHKFEGEKI